ncbi:MATE family efflux transporter [Aestuariispira insulae]|uniref:Multidrug export protein MepA n=1 Tax=Aestuariispira insulae TaxID=1461337 RepID=A0A3D9HF92_9PROT|nr:MATE family efflux transporter [Aestuariispira insulae]RED48147.1 putative MATE family efflux protein [Aestuariispira insulae]
MKQDPNSNFYLHGSLPLLFLKTAAPIVLVMLASGIHTLVDAWFLGRFVGAQALTAVTLMFPFFMLMVALSTLVSNGYASVVARLLGAGRMGEAQSTYLGASLVALLIALTLIMTFLLVGTDMVQWLARGDAVLGNLGYSYIAPMIFGSFLMMTIGVNVDSLRCEGRMGFMTLVTLIGTLMNIPFNYLLIVEMDMGVPGSAYGTLLAQSCSLIAILIYRALGQSSLGFRPANGHPILKHWKEFLALGLPFSLSYVGVSLIAFLVLYDLQVWAPENYEQSAAAYGIVTRLMTFSYMPILGLSLAFQAILGNNFGAGDIARSRKSFHLALMIAFAYCALLQIVYQGIPDHLAAIFVDDTAIIAETARILPIMTFLFVLFGPQNMATTYFQAVGDAGRALALSVSRMYLLALPLIFGLPYLIGEPGIWIANPVTEILMMVVTTIVFISYWRKNRMAAAAAI